MMIHGITPGPLLVQEHPDVFWGVIASMYLGNVMLLALNLPMVGLFVQVFARSVAVSDAERAAPVRRRRLCGEQLGGASLSDGHFRSDRLCAAQASTSRSLRWFWHW